MARREELMESVKIHSIPKHAHFWNPVADRRCNQSLWTLKFSPDIAESEIGVQASIPMPGNRSRSSLSHDNGIGFDSANGAPHKPG